MKETMKLFIYYNTLFLFCEEVNPIQNKLEAFINQVEAKLDGRKIDEDIAYSLIAEAEKLVEELEEVKEA